MMNCHQILDQYSLLLDGRLEPAKRSALKLHLAACEECRLQTERMATANELLSRVGAVKAPADLLASTLDQVELPAAQPHRAGILQGLVAAGLGALTVNLLWTDAISSGELSKHRGPLTSLQAPGLVRSELLRLQQRPEGRLLAWVRNTGREAEGEGR